MTSDKAPPPGSNAAIARGCTCPVLDNGRGKGYMGVSGIYVFSASCPIHSKHEADQ